MKTNRRQFLKLLCISAAASIAPAIFTPKVEDTEDVEFEENDCRFREFDPYLENNPDDYLFNNGSLSYWIFYSKELTDEQIETAFSKTKILFLPLAPLWDK